MRTLAFLISILILAVATAVLLGWALDVRLLGHAGPDLPAMPPATAVAFVLSAVSIAAVIQAQRVTEMRSVALRSENNFPWRLLGQISAGIVTVIGLFRLASLTGQTHPWNVELGFEAPPSIAGEIALQTVARMPVATALDFVLLGAALWCLASNRFARLAQTSILIVLLVGWLGLTRYVYGGAPLPAFTTMAPAAAALFIASGVAAICLSPQNGMVALLRRRGVGGAIARRLLPVAIVVPLGIGWLTLHFERAGWLGVEAAFALFSLAGVVLFSALVVINAMGLDASEHARVQAQEALQLSETRTRLILERALDAVISIDKAGIITQWNSQAESTFGWSAAEAVGRLLSDTIVPPAQREAHRRGLERYLATGESRMLGERLELEAVDRQGRLFPAEIAIVPIRTAKDIGFSAFVRDITERKRGEQRLRESEAHFRTLAESLPQLVWTCRPDGWCDYLSRQWLEYTGRTHEQQVGYGWAEQLHPQDADRVQREWAKAAAQGQYFDIEFRIRRHDGVYRWFKTRAVPLRNDSGEIVKWFGSNTDFEDFKQSETRLRTHLERMVLLDRITKAIGEHQDAASIFGIVLDSIERDLGIDFACIGLQSTADSALVVRRSGARSAGLAHALELVEESEIPVDANGLSRCLRGQLVHEPELGMSDFAFPRRLVRAGLHSLVVAPLAAESSVFGVLIAARRASHTFTSGECEFLRQLSEHVALAAHQAQLYGALETAYQDLGQSQQAVMQQERLRALGQMASGIAHDINNAISPVSLYTDTLLEKEPHLSAQGRSQLQTIQRAIHDVAATVARMREFYRQREPQLALSPVQLNELVQQVVDLTRARWSDMPQQRGISVEVRTELDTRLPTIMGVESEIREALTNLVFNAVDAMPDGGTLTLLTRSVTPDKVQVDVRDTGEGMDETTRRHCFEPFFTTKGERGTGLGLAMVYGVVKRHSAEIDIESAPGMGTTVQLRFAAATQRVAPAPIQTLQPVPTGMRLLIVDDDPLLLQSLRDALAGDGHTVVCANGGQEGVDRFRASLDGKAVFDAVVTDLGMPYIDGRQVASTVKATSPLTPVILLTGWGQRLVTEGDIPPHVDILLSKPPKLRDLREALARCQEGI